MSSLDNMRGLSIPLLGIFWPQNFLQDSGFLRGGVGAPLGTPPPQVGGWGLVNWDPLLPRGGWVGLAKGDPPPPEVGGWVNLPLTLLPSGYSPNIWLKKARIQASDVADNVHHAHFFRARQFWGVYVHEL